MATKSGVVCADEYLLIPQPYKLISEWCDVRFDYTKKRLMSIPNGVPVVVINHYQLFKKLDEIYTFLFGVVQHSKRYGSIYLLLKFMDISIFVLQKELMA